MLFSYIHLGREIFIESNKGEITVLLFILLVFTRYSLNIDISRIICLSEKFSHVEDCSIRKNKSKVNSKENFSFILHILKDGHKNKIGIIFGEFLSLNEAIMWWTLRSRAR